MGTEDKRVQVNMSKKLRDSMRDWAAEMAKATDEEVGIGTVSAQLLEELAKHPDLIQQLLFKEAAKVKK